MPEVKPDIQTFAKIIVVGVGGGGGSAINRMIQSKIKGVEFFVVNTDLQALHANLATNKLHIGKATTRGLGSGMNPAIGKKAAEESQNEIREALKGADMVFIAAGLGGGTGSGAGPKVAEIAREMGALTVAVVTKPFEFEGGPRKRVAEEALKEFKSKVDTLITIPNERIWQIIDKKTSLMDAFAVVDEVLRQGVQGISELITLQGLINVDFADVKTIMSNSGCALMGMGESSGDNRAVEAAKAAVSSPLLEMSINGAKGILFTITGGADLAMYEVSEAAKIITDAVDGDARIIFGAVIDENQKDKIKITVVATGFEESLVPQNNMVRVVKPMKESAPFNYFAAPIKNPQSAAAPAPQPQQPMTQTERKQAAEEKYVFEQPKRVEREVFEEPEEIVDNNTNRVQEEQLNNNQNNNQNNNNNNSFEEKGGDDDLEIPPFIKRKMM